MRGPTIVLLATALALTGLTAPCRAQVQQGDPNAANRALSGAGQSRAVQQGQTSQSNAAAASAQRSQTAAPPPPPAAAGPTVTVPRVGR